MKTNTIVLLVILIIVIASIFMFWDKIKAMLSSKTPSAGDDQQYMYEEQGAPQPYSSVITAMSNQIAEQAAIPKTVEEVKTAAILATQGRGGAPGGARPGATPAQISSAKIAVAGRGGVSGGSRPGATSAQTASTKLAVAGRGNAMPKKPVVNTKPLIKKPLATSGRG